MVNPKFLTWLRSNDPELDLFFSHSRDHETNN